eukprot:scaffold452406_cov36-Prasinocladus_malaysianus.AAC.2
MPDRMLPALGGCFNHAVWLKTCDACTWQITFFGDSDGSFTKAMGLEVDLTGAGLGPAMRSNRYSMFVTNGEIVKFVRPPSYVLSVYKLIACHFWCPVTLCALYVCTRKEVCSWFGLTTHLTLQNPEESPADLKVSDACTLLDQLKKMREYNPGMCYRGDI